jgi:hypothetical protein
MGQIAKQEAFEQIEKILTDGNLQALTAEQRVQYVQRLCESLKLNSLSRPLQFIKFQGGRVSLYATRSATDQLRKIHGVSIEITQNIIDDGLIVVGAKATDREGRIDEDIASIPCQNLRGEALANARMKCVTKAKRRVTLSICGLGILDESELDTIPGCQKISTPAPRPENIEAKESLKAKMQAKAKPKAKPKEITATKAKPAEQFVYEELPEVPGGK